MHFIRIGPRRSEEEIRELRRAAAHRHKEARKRARAFGEKYAAETFSCYEDLPLGSVRKV